MGGLGRGLLPDALLFAAVNHREVLRLEGVTVGPEVGEQFPVVLGVEGLDFALAVNDESQRRRLDAADGDEVVTEATGRQREKAGERGPPHQVHDLPGLAGGREVEVYLVGVVEGRTHLPFRDGGEANAVHGSVGLLADDLVRLDADEFALAVVVGGDGDAVGGAGQRPEFADDVLAGGGLAHLGVHEFDGFDRPPVLVLGREVHADDVTGETHTDAGDPLARSLVGPAVNVDLLAGDRRAAVAEYVRDPAGGVVLLRDDQFDTVTLAHWRRLRRGCC